MASMSAESVRSHGGTTKALVAYEAQLVMYCSQVVDDVPLVLSIFSAPKAVCVTSKAPEGIGVMNSL